MKYNLSLRQLKTILVVSEQKRLIKASEILSLTPPAVTIQLRQAEEEIGLLLFDRTSDGLKLTDAGSEVAKCAQNIFGQLNDLSNKIDEVNFAKRGSVKVGIVSTAKYFGHNLIAEFIKDNPKIKTYIKVASREEILKKLSSFELDFAITGTVPLNKDLDTKVFGDHPIIFIASPKSHLVKKNKIKKIELINQKILTRENGSGTLNTLQSFLDETKLAFEPSLTEVGSNETIKQAVMSNIGIAMISEHCCINEIKYNLLKKLNVEGLPIIKKWYVTKLKTRQLSHSSKLLYSYIVENGKNFLP